MRTGQPRSRVIEFENSSWVVPRGVRHTEWFVELGSAWTRVADAPGAAAVEAGDDADVASANERNGFVVRPPGCQYLCRFRLLLPFGTAVRRRVSKPRDVRKKSSSAGSVSVDLRRDILTYFRFAKPPLGVVETDFRVARGGLVSEVQWERAAAGRASGDR